MTILTFTANNAQNHSRTGDSAMKNFNRKFSVLGFAAAIALTSATPAFADSASSKAKNKLAELQEHMETLEGIRSEINGFTVRDSYCKKRHKNDKRAHEQRLEQLTNRANAEMREISNIRRVLIHTVNRNQAARTALDHLVPGGTGTIVDGSYFKPFNTLRNAVRKALSKKTDALGKAPAYRCGGVIKSAAPAFVVVNPIVEVPLTGDYEDAAFITLPNKFCHRDEKNVWYDAIDAQREKAQRNELAAERLRDRLRELKAQVTAKRQQTWKDADAAAKSGKTSSLNNLTSQLKVYDEALKKLTAAINTAKADIARWKKLDLQLLSQREALTGAPITDCLKDDIAPSDTLGFSNYGDLPESIPSISLDGMEIKEVEFIELPKKVCFEEMKRSYEMKAGKQNSNAYHNSSLWSSRLEAIRSELLRLGNAGNASPDLVKKLNAARREAREELAKWEKIQIKTQEIADKAYAIKVVDCSGAGGKTEIGRLDPGFSEISNEIPAPNLQDYDLPSIPQKICTHKELEALRLRAAKAREVSAQNRKEWGKRLNALGKLLFQGETSDAYPVSPEYAAHLDAQRQYDYWSAQQDVAHKVYWDLMQRKHDDCSKSDKKVSLNDALQDARNGAPVFNGGQNNGFGGAPFGRDCIINNGGCFYPDPRKDWMYDRSGTQGGFDGGEAEHALNRTLDGVKIDPKPKHDAQNYQQQPETGQQTPAHDHSDGKPCAEHGVTGKTLIEKMPDVVKTPSETQPVPVPYPNISKGADTATGSDKVSIGNTEVKTKSGTMTETRSEPVPNEKGVNKTPGAVFTTPSFDVKAEQGVRKIETPTPAALDKRNVTLAPSATQKQQTLTIPGQAPSGQMTAVKAPPLVLNDTALSYDNAGYSGGYAKEKTGGEFVQVKPPVLVITPQGGSAADRPTAAALEQEGQN